MSVEEIKRVIAALTPAERDEVATFLKCLRLTSTKEFQDTTNARLNDCDPSHWLTPDEFEEASISDAQRQELERRYQEYLANPTDSSPWPEARERLHRILKARRTSP